MVIHPVYWEILSTSDLIELERKLKDFDIHGKFYTQWYHVQSELFVRGYRIFNNKWTMDEDFKNQKRL